MSAWTKNCAELPSGNGERAVVPTIAPPVAKRRTIASPTPLVPPVMKTRFPAIRLDSSAPTTRYDERFCSGMDALGRHERQRRHCIDMLGRGCPCLSAFEGIAKELDERAIAFHGYERNH